MSHARSARWTTSPFFRSTSRLGCKASRAIIGPLAIVDLRRLRREERDTPRAALGQNQVAPTHDLSGAALSIAPEEAEAWPLKLLWYGAPLHGKQGRARA